MQTNTEIKKPKPWKMLLIAFLLVYPVVNIVFAILGPYIIHLQPMLTSLIISIVLIPAFGLGVPALQKKFYKWTVK